MGNNNAIETYRRQKKLSYQTLADMLGADKSTVWKHCHGRCVPEGRFLVLYQGLGICISNLVHDPPPAHAGVAPDP